MKKTFIAFAAVAASFLFASCAKMNDGVSEAKGYTVTLIEESDKTTLTEGDDCATFAWEEADCNYIKIYKYTDPSLLIEASSVSAVLNDGKMVVTATFDGPLVAGTKIFGYYGKTCYSGSASPMTVPKVAAAQDCSAGKYDSASDILVIDPIELAEGTSNVLFKFRRPVGIGKMTLKGIPAGTEVSTVKLTTDDHIVERRQRFHNTDSDSHKEVWYWTGGTSSTARLLTLTVNGTVASDGTLPVWMVIDPSLGNGRKHFKIEAETADGDIYSKDISDKDVQFAEGKVTRFNVVVSKGDEPEPEPEETITVAWTVWNGKTFVNPFPDIAFATSAGTAKWAGEPTDFVLPLNGKKYTFIFYSQKGISRNSGGRITFNAPDKADEDYVKFPVIAGYTITGVTIQGSHSTDVKIMKFAEDGAVKIGDKKVLSDYADTSWEITDDNTGVQCGMVVAETTGLYLRAMSITYSLASKGSFGTAGAPGQDAGNVDYNNKL